MDKTAKKGPIKKAIGKVQQSATDYKALLEQAYNTGYKTGYNDAQHISKKFGSRASATIGYSRGLRDYGRHEKLMKQLNKK